jgi:hypothetical protein
MFNVQHRLGNQIQNMKMCLGFVYDFFTEVNEPKIVNFSFENYQMLLIEKLHSMINLDPFLKRKLGNLITYLLMRH